MLLLLLLCILYSLASLVPAINASTDLSVEQHRDASVWGQDNHKKPYSTRAISSIIDNNNNINYINSNNSNLYVNDDNINEEDPEFTTPASQRPLYQNRRRFLFSGIVIVLGVIGNFLALLILARKKALKHNKYTFMLR